MEYAIEKAAIKDLDEVYLIKCECADDMDNKGIFQWDEIYPAKDIFKDDILSEKSYILSQNNIILGFVTINSEQDTEYNDVKWEVNSKYIGVIHRFMIRPKAQGKGYAKVLLDFSEKTAKSMGFDVLRLDAFKNNSKALKLYERNGYKYVGEVKFRKGRFNCYEKVI